MRITLDFKNLDDLAFAASRGVLGEPPQMDACQLGPLVELSQLAQVLNLPVPSRAPWLRLSALAGLVEAMTNSGRFWVCSDSNRLGFLKGSTTPPDQSTWTQFGLAAQKAATAVGFSQPLAAQLAAAARELHDNIYEHSGSPKTGLIAFQAHHCQFELVIADRGMGVLQSLKSSREYSSLSHHATALEVILKDGVSRHGAGSERGHGFRPIFVGLANLKGTLRFRSGDHALLIDGTALGSMPSRLAQKPSLQGFFVSVRCEAPAQPISHL